MAVSRSIGNHGFDMETFARIELPVWPSYGLGGGRASKAATKNLSASGALWYANTFRGWCDAGGNGAAMRIQPHVWASADLDGSYLLDVITDSICTHGQPRAIVGACFHASVLAHCIRTGIAPNLDECAETAANLGDALSLIQNHQNLSTVWIGLWERETGKQPPEEPLDSPYLLSEADRLTAISQDHQIDNHQYPDTLTWAAPQTQADALVTDDHQLAVEGLGPVKELDTDLSWSPRKDFAWQWVQTDFGQTLLIKRRPELRPQIMCNTSEPPPAPSSTARSRKPARADNQTSCPPSELPLDRGLDFDAAVRHAKEHISNDSQLGYTVRRAARDGTINDLVDLVKTLRDDLRR